MSVYFTRTYICILRSTPRLLFNKKKRKIPGCANLELTLALTTLLSTATADIVNNRINIEQNTVINTIKLYAHTSFDGSAYAE